MLFLVRCAVKTEIMTFSNSFYAGRFAPSSGDVDIAAYHHFRFKSHFGPLKDENNLQTTTFAFDYYLKCLSNNLFLFSAFGSLNDLFSVVKNRDLIFCCHLWASKKYMKNLHLLLNKLKLTKEELKYQSKVLLYTIKV